MIAAMTTSGLTGGLDGLQFDNRFTRALPADPVAENYSRQVPGACFSRVQPVRVRAPRLLAFASEIATDLLGLSEETCRSEEFAEVFSGNRQLPGMDPFAMCYGGHQFGHWAGQLGDGRAINLGEALVRGEHWILQLKGAGPTPYSRSADGFAVLRSSVREFLCSEAMHHLGVPTTRALSLVGTGESIVRDMFYDGNPEAEPGAIVCRVARSFTRFGNFQVLAARRETELLRQLVDHTIRSDYPHLGAPSREVYAQWFQEVCDRTSTMIVHWMRVGFVHGVMNTDNMSILGETIDYGPYGWLEDYDLGWTPNTTDAGQRRYCFGNQASIAHWNLAQLANAIAVLMEDDTDPLRDTLQAYAETYVRDWRSMMMSKLGLPAGEPEADQALNDELLEILQLVETDMTIFYRRLAEVDLECEDERALVAPLEEAYYTPEDVSDEVRTRTVNWLRQLAARVRASGQTPEHRRAAMNAVNPIYVLRNYQAQLAIEAAEQGDLAPLEALQAVLRHPYEERAGLEAFAAKRPEWARHRPGCSTLSCSS